jgi:hypothetical protein
VYHEQTSNDPTAGGSGSTCPSGTRYVDVLSPLPTQSYTLHFQVALSGSTDHARVYYTTNGSAPVGSYGVPGANTFVAVANYQCSFRTPAGAPVDICSAAIPPLPGGTVVNYIISAWQAVTPPSPEIFANGGQCGGSTCATIFTYRVIPTTPINLTCSPNLTVTATSPNGAVVNYNSSATGGCSQPVVTCTPRSGSTFPIGTSDFAQLLNEHHGEHHRTGRCDRNLLNGFRQRWLWRA